MTRPRLGLALGSGSARGWALIGVIDVLIEAGIEPDIACCTSMGSFVGAIFVTGRLNELRQWAEAAIGELFITHLRSNKIADRQSSRIDRCRGTDNVDKLATAPAARQWRPNGAAFFKCAAWSA